MNGHTPYRTGRFLALFAALLLPLAACSGSDDPETAATEPAIEATTEPVETEETPTELDTETATEEPTDMATEMETETEAADAGTDTDTAAGTTDIVAALTAAGLPTLAAAVETAGLDEQLESLPAFTLFAPSDDALAALAPLPTDPAEVQDLLTYHVVDEQVRTSDLAEGENTFTTLQGSELTITTEGGEVMVGDGGATVTEADIDIGDTGVVHIIDEVLEPSA